MGPAVAPAVALLHGTIAPDRTFFLSGTSTGGWPSGSPSGANISLCRFGKKLTSAWAVQGPPVGSGVRTAEQRRADPPGADAARPT
jgi:hypothetical protein